MFKLIFALTLIMIGFARREDRSTPCFDLNCLTAANATENCTAPLNCKYGTTIHGLWCSCCPVCAKGPGETCGNFKSGACAPDLKCCVSNSYIHYSFFGVPNTVGTCYSTCPPSTTTNSTTTTTIKSE